MPADPLRDQLDRALAAIIDAVGAGVVVAIHLYGSAMAGGLRPDSDLDLFVVVRRRLSPAEKRRLVDRLRPISRRGQRPAGWWPLEVTVVAASDVRPWRTPPRFDLQYGEWLTDADLDAQIEGGPTDHPDVGVLGAMVRAESRPLLGPPASEAVDAVPPVDLRRAIGDALPALLDDLEGDTRNVLLTLARMWVTVVTGRFIPKDEAADWAIERLRPQHRPILARARDLYRGRGWGQWDDDMVAVRAVAGHIAQEVGSGARRHGPFAAADS